MGHPVIDEIGRVYQTGNIQSHAFRRWQRVLRDEVQPILDDYERLQQENHGLREENVKLAKKGKKPEAVAE